MFDSIVACPRVSRRRRRGSDTEGDKNEKNFTWVQKCAVDLVKPQSFCARLIIIIKPIAK